MLIEALSGILIAAVLVCGLISFVNIMLEKHTLFHLFCNTHRMKCTTEYVTMPFKTFVRLYRVLRQKHEEIGELESWIEISINYPPSYLYKERATYDRCGYTKEYYIIFPHAIDYVRYRHFVRSEMRNDNRRDIRKNESKEGYKVIIKDLEAERNRHRKAEEESIRKARETVDSILQAEY